MQQSIQQITYKTYKYAYVRAELTPMESTYHLYIIKVNDILGSMKQEENKNFYIVLQVSLNGNPQNYRSRGFKTSADYGVFASKNINLPAVECLMIQELVEGALKDVSGYLDYSFYDTLK